MLYEVITLSTRKEDMLRDICIEHFLAGMEPCNGFSEEKVENKELQIELVKMSVDDQAVRGSMMYDIISKYNIA